MARAAIEPTYPAPVLAFGRSLGGPDAEPLRAHLDRSCVRARVGGPISVDGFFELVARLGDLAIDAEDRSAARYHVVLDLQRFVVFRDSGVAGDPGIASLVRYLIDGYPLQPFKRFAEAEADRPYRLAFDPAVLDLVPRCLEELAPCEYAVGDLLTGELTRARLCPHPQAAPPKIVPPRHPAPPPALREITTDRGLRAGSPPELGDFVEKGAGVIRREDLWENFVSLPYAKTLVSSSLGAKHEHCFGVALSPAEARAVARCEAVERFQVGKQPPGIELVRGSYAELAEFAVDPRELFLGRSPECPDDDGEPFDPAIPLYWVWAWGVGEGRWRLVPAQEVWYNSPNVMSERRLSIATTSGCAVGTSVEEAAIFAALEAIERDGFLTSWYLRRAAREIDCDSFEDDDLRDLLSRVALQLTGYRLVPFDLTSDVGVPTVGMLAIRESGRGPRVLAAAAAHVDAERACMRALKELVRFRSWPQMTPERLAQVRARTVVPPTPDGHFELYALDETFAAFDDLRLGENRRVSVREIGLNSPVPAGPRLRLDLVLEAVARRLREVGAGLYVRDCTHPLFARRGLRIVRAITPGLYPMWFGSRSRRFAVSERLRRLAKIYTGRPFLAERLQLAPHPMP